MAGLAQVNNIYVGQGGRKMAAPVLDRGTYLAQRDTEDNKRNFHKARYSENEEEAKAAKMALKQYAYNSMLPTGVLRGACLPTGLFAHDIDIATDEEVAQHQYDDVRRRADEMVKQILERKDEIGLRELSRTPHFGLHLICEREMGRTILENQVRLSMLFHTEMDTNNKDYSRIMFAGPSVSEDGEELLYLDDRMFECPLTVEQSEEEYRVLKERQQNNMEDVPEGAKKRNKHFRAYPCPPQGMESLNALAAEKENNQETQADDTIKHLHFDPTQKPLGVIGSAASLVEEGLVRLPSYLGIPYSEIIAKWWGMYNDGQEPVKSNRDVLTFELAVNLRHICGFDRELMGKVIPCYDGFSEAQKMKCIDSALAEKRTQMPKRLKDVLQSLTKPSQKEGCLDYLHSLDEVYAKDELFHYDRLPKMPQGVKDSIDAAGHSLAMPTLIAIAPAIGALATGVKLDVHGKAKGLNLCSFVVGEFASGKGQMDDIIAAWMAELQAETDIYTQQEEEWAQKTKRMKSGKAPEQPKLPVRMLTLNNTVANIAERLANTEGKHSFSFTPEADNVALKWKQSVSDFSVMLRQAYDEARFDREAKSADAVRVHIAKLLWNVTMCGTQDALYRVVTNYTDGLLSRLAIARTPDNTFAPLAENPAQLTDIEAERIQQVAHLLPLMKGTVVLPKLEERGREWLEVIRLEAMKNDDRVLARQRMRGCVNAQRITTALWLPKVAELLIKKYGMNGAETRLKQNPQLWVEMLKRQQTEDMLQLFDIIADYLLDNDLFYFRDRIEKAYEGNNYQGNLSAIRSRKGKNDNIFSRLSDEFTFEQALQQSIAVKGTSATRNSVHQMLKNWKNQGLVSVGDDGHYKKVSINPQP